MKIQHPLARTLVTARSWPFFMDLAVAAVALAAFLAIVSTGVYWLGKPVPVVPISNSIGALPLYAFYSIVRMGDRVSAEPDLCHWLRVHCGLQPAR